VDASGAPLRVIIFTALPGTGKSTLAEQVARTLSAPAFAGDWLMGALKPAHAALGRLERSEYVAAWFSLLRTLVTRQLMLGQSAVVDDVVSESQYPLWRETAVRFSARLFLIECICSDEAIHRARIEGRTRGIPGWPEVGWDHVEQMRAEVVPLTADRLTA
jgi:predicted kinase